MPSLPMVPLNMMAILVAARLTSTVAHGKSRLSAIFLHRFPASSGLLHRVDRPAALQLEFGNSKGRAKIEEWEQGALETSAHYTAFRRGHFRAFMLKLYNACSRASVPPSRARRAESELGKA